MNTELTDEQTDGLASPYIRSVGDHWASEQAIADDGSIEGFARAAIAAAPQPAAQKDLLYEARFKRLVEMEASLAPEDRIAYYVRNPHELDRIIKLEAIVKECT